MEKINCDVLIVGASAAGLGAALALADSKLNVLCVDKKQGVGKPIKCAEGVGKFFVNILPVKIPRKLLSWKIKGIAFIKDEKILKKIGPIWEGFSIDRGKVESYYYKLCKEKGIKFLFNSKLFSASIKDNSVIDKAVFRTHRNRIVNIFPKFVIAADGVDSTVYALCKFSKRKKICGEIVNYEVKSNNLSLTRYEQIYLGDFAPNGYGFIFPKSKKIANVGVGCILPKHSMQKSYKKFLGLPFVKQQLRGMVVLKDKSKRAPFGDQLNECVKGNVVFCGDIANHNYKPFVEGFLPSLISGFGAGKLVASGDFSQENYAQLIKDSLPGFAETKILQKAMLKVFKTSKGMKSSLLLLLSAGLIPPEKIMVSSKSRVNNLIDKKLVNLKYFE